MTTVASLDAARIELEPGHAASCELTIGNRGEIVEAYRFRVVGGLAAHAWVEPEQLSLYPGTEGSVTVNFAIPRSHEIRAGDVPFAVVVSPQERAEDRAVPEGVVEVLQFSDVVAELTPRTAEARIRSKHLLAVDNQGNYPVKASIAAGDPDNHLRVRAHPATVYIEPGEAVFAEITTKARRLVWTGQPAQRAFQVDIGSEEVRSGTAKGARPDGLPGPPTAPIPALDGRVVQEPLIHRNATRFLALAALGVVALAGLWFAVLRPTIETAAEDAVENPLTAAQERAASAEDAAVAAQEQASQAAGEANAAAGVAGQTAVERLAATGAQPFNRRIVVVADPEQAETEVFEVPDGQVVTVTDLVFESRGDFGQVRLLRDEEVFITAQAENFRTLDQHFVSPLIFTAGQEIRYELNCVQPAQLDLLAAVPPTSAAPSTAPGSTAAPPTTPTTTPAEPPPSEPPAQCQAALLLLGTIQPVPESAAPAPAPGSATEPGAPPEATGPP